MRVISFARVAAAVVGIAACLIGGMPAGAAPADYDIPNGHFYSEAASNGGFTIVDDADANMWSEFQRLGGVATLGYPMSKRFNMLGAVSQVTQRSIMQWRPGLQQVELANLLDLMHENPNFDQWLAQNRLTPPPVDVDEAGLTFQEVASRRLGWLDSNPAIKDAYNNQVPGADPVLLWGLPTTPPTDLKDLVVVRTQRAVFQQWKNQMPWAAPGQVTIALSGSLAIESGFLNSFLDPSTLQPIPPP